MAVKTLQVHPALLGAGRSGGAGNSRAADRLGKLEVGWAVKLASPDRRLAEVVELRDALLLARTACGDWLRWKLQGGLPGERVDLEDLEITRDPDVARSWGWSLTSSFDRREPRAGPAGYEFVKAGDIRAGLAVGLWRALDGRRSLLGLIRGDGAAAQVEPLAELPFKAQALSVLPDPHGAAVRISVMSRAPPGRPTYYVHLYWRGQ